ARPCARGKSLFARNRQIELIRDNCGIGKMDSRARSRKIPHPAIHGGVALVERNHAAKESARPKMRRLPARDS
ncbi:MAG: hypothetical protein WA756_08080, partial [Pseudolabrys sp.]